MSKSCCGCKYLYGNGTGYSNYTWMETYVKCVLDRNPNLMKETPETEEPYDWSKDPKNDNFLPTQSSRCEVYSPGPYFTADPDREDDPREFEGIDLKVADAIRKHADYYDD